MSKLDIRALYNEVFDDVIHIDIVDTCKMWANYDFDYDRIKEHMSAEITHIEKKLLPEDGWRDVRLEYALPIKRSLYRVMFCSLEEVPLCINDLFSEIARWRLKNSV